MPHSLTILLFHQITCRNKGTENPRSSQSKPPKDKHPTRRIFPKPREPDPVKEARSFRQPARIRDEDSRSQFGELSFHRPGGYSCRGCRPPLVPASRDSDRPVNPEFHGVFLL